ncbi:M20/M25/M40 family metallo-hydrolase [Candidatus Electronema sp. JM]|uniref:M20/M25/M40 family metallo-hydrolase n=1 Tax=Candidatus Electronema sp. JM TaxID=3401571 RepID=UPI003AA80553
MTISILPVNRERLARTFIRLCETDSPSGEEGRMAALVTELLCSCGAPPPFEDDSAAQTGSQCGNLMFRFDGDPAREPLFFCCHLDTVEPGRGIKVIRQGDRFTSSGDTILGSDDKSAIAALIEAWQVLQEHGLPHAPLEFIFTTSEEIGLLGAKALDPAQVRAKMGYALDSSGFGRVLIGAPASNRLSIRVKGAAAHAGLHPEKGISAVMLAAKALAAAPSGRIDHETTVNFGTIHGGTATNIVPEDVLIEGEVRSHSMVKLERLTREIEAAFRSVISGWQDMSGQAQGRPELDFQAVLDFPAMKLGMEDAVIRRIADAAASISMELRYEIAGGGSDANIFNGCGLPTAIVATGMTNVHSTAEEVSLEDMSQLTRLVLALALA